MSVGKGRAGHRAGPSRPLQLSRSPLSPPEGEFPPTTPSGGSRGRARAFLCSSPVTAPAFSLPRSGKGGCRPFPLPQGPAPPLLILARCFISRPQALISPARWLPLHRFTDLFGWRPALQSPGSRRGVAPGRLGAPPAAPFSPALPRGCHRPSGPGCAPPLRPHGFPRPSAPVGLPVLPPGPAGRPLRGDRPAPPTFCTSLLPGPGRPHCVRTAGPRALRPAPRPQKDADAPLGRFCLVLRAVGRQALRADCLGPPVF